MQQRAKRRHCVFADALQLSRGLDAVAIDASERARTPRVGIRVDLLRGIAVLDLVQQVRRPDQAAVALALHDETVAIACNRHRDLAALDRREVKSTRELIFFDGCASEVARQREEVDRTRWAVDVDAK
jgi:hypothetical protein